MIYTGVYIPLAYMILHDSCFPEGQADNGKHTCLATGLHEVVCCWTLAPWALSGVLLRQPTQQGLSMAQP